MLALDNFISPILDFDGVISIPVVPVSTQPLSDKFVSDASARASSSATKTQASKWKAAPTRLLKKGPKKSQGDLQ
jgi:hypothetical protein